MSNGIPAKKKNFGNFSNVVTACIRQSRIEPCHAEDISTSRLIRRTAGNTIPENLCEKRIAIIGCGSLGSLIVDGLTRSGIREYLLCDNDSFRPENLARHLLLSPSLFSPKVTSLADHITMRLPDAKVQVIGSDIRTSNGLSALQSFNPDLILCATGDTNTDLTLSDAVFEGNMGPCCFAWVEPNLVAGHLVFQPRGSASILRQLHSEEGKEGRYCHALVGSPEGLLMKESGCQSSFTPYSGLDMVLFAAHVSKKIISWLIEPAVSNEVLRITLDEGSRWETLSC